MSVEWYEGYDAGYADGAGMSGGNRKPKVDWRMYAFLVGYIAVFAIVLHFAMRAAS